MTTEKFAEISNLVAEMKKQGDNLSSQLHIDSIQAQKDRDELSDQIRSLLEVVKMQSASILGIQPIPQMPSTGIHIIPNSITDSSLYAPFTHNFPIQLGDNTFKHTVIDSEPQIISTSVVSNHRYKLHEPKPPPAPPHVFHSPETPQLRTTSQSCTSTISAPKMFDTSPSRESMVSAIVRNSGIINDSRHVNPSVSMLQGFDKSCGQHSYVLPVFDGTDPRDWILKARNYFEFRHESDTEKICLAGIHFQGRASTWYRWFYQKRSENFEWKIFLHDLLVRFDNYEVDMCNLVNPLNIQQQGSVKEYMIEFLETKEIAEYVYDFVFTEEILAHNFVNGLKEEIRETIDLWSLQTLQGAVNWAKFHESQMEERMLFEADEEEYEMYEGMKRLFKEIWALGKAKGDGICVAGIATTPKKYVKVINSFEDAELLLGKVSEISSSLEDVVEDGDRKKNGVENGDKQIIVVNCKDEQKQFDTEEMPSIILMEKKESVEVSHGRKTTKNIFFTLPSHFNDLQRQATSDADTIFGFKLATTAIVSGLDKESQTVGMKVILNFDPGGSILHVSLRTVEEGIFRLHVTTSDTLWRCEDFSNGMVNYSVQEFNRKNGRDINGLSDNNNMHLYKNNEGYHAGFRDDYNFGHKRRNRAKIKVGGDATTNEINIDSIIKNVPEVERLLVEFNGDNVNIVPFRSQDLVLQAANTLHITSVPLADSEIISLVQLNWCPIIDRSFRIDGITNAGKNNSLLSGCYFLSFLVPVLYYHFFIWSLPYVRRSGTDMLNIYGSSSDNGKAIKLLNKICWTNVELSGALPASRSVSKITRCCDIDVNISLLAIGVLYDDLKQTELYICELKRMLACHIFLEVNSSVFQLSTKAEGAVGVYTRIGLADIRKFYRAIQTVEVGMRYIKFLNLAAAFWRCLDTDVAEIYLSYFALS